MARKNFQGKRGINPALARMNTQQKDNLLISSAYKANMVLGLTVLHDKFGFGQKRLERYIDEVVALLDSYNKGYINVQDLEQVLLDEVKLKITT